jgi:hypothetical protein
VPRIDESKATVSLSKGIDKNVLIRAIKNAALKDIRTKVSIDLSYY